MRIHFLSLSVKMVDVNQDDQQVDELKVRGNNILQSWYQSELDIESFEQKLKSIIDTINKVLDRRQLDGTLSSLWHQLVYHISEYCITCLYRKRDIITKKMTGAYQDYYLYTGNVNQQATEWKVRNDSLCERLNNAFQSWCQSVLDIESFEQKAKSITDAINKALHRKQLDGLLSSIEYVEVMYINSLWHQLIYHISLYRSTCLYRKREIISLLMELYTNKQLTQDMLIESCIDL